MREQVRCAGEVYGLGRRAFGFGRQLALADSGMALAAALVHLQYGPIKGFGNCLGEAIAGSWFRVASSGHGGAHETLVLSSSGHGGAHGIHGVHREGLCSADALALADNLFGVDYGCTFLAAHGTKWGGSGASSNGEKPRAPPGTNKNLKIVARCDRGAGHPLAGGGVSGLRNLQDRLCQFFDFIDLTKEALEISDTWAAVGIEQ